MKIIHAMILDQRAAKRFAGRTVKAMIRQGCSGRIMRMRKMPQSVYHWTLGARAHTSRTPDDSATYLIDQYRADFLGLPNSRHEPDGGKAAPKAL